MSETNESVTLESRITAIEDRIADRPASNHGHPTARSLTTPFRADLARQRLLRLRADQSADGSGDGLRRP
jgi:hypothetical protein